MTTSDRPAPPLPLPPWVERNLPKPPLAVREELSRGLLVAIVMTMLGAPAGVLWAYSVPHLAVFKIGSPAYLLTDNAEDLAAMGGDLVMIAILLSIGSVAALVVHFASRQAQLGPFIGLLVGGTLCGVIAMAVGHTLVEGDYDAVFAHLSDGTIFQIRPYVRGSADFLVLPLFAAFVYGIAQLPALWRGTPKSTWAPPDVSSGVAVSASGTAPEPPPSL
jgi:hypothetical protein